MSRIVIAPSLHSVPHQLISAHHTKAQTTSVELIEFECLIRELKVQTPPPGPTTSTTIPNAKRSTTMLKPPPPPPAHPQGQPRPAPSTKENRTKEKIRKRVPISTINAPRTTGNTRLEKEKFPSRKDPPATIITTQPPATSPCQPQSEHSGHEPSLQRRVVWLLWWWVVGGGMGGGYMTVQP